MLLSKMLESKTLKPLQVKFIKELETFTPSKEFLVENIKTKTLYIIKVSCNTGDTALYNMKHHKINRDYALIK